MVKKVDENMEFQQVSYAKVYKIISKSKNWTHIINTIAAINFVITTTTWLVSTGCTTILLNHYVYADLYPLLNNL